MCYDCWREAGSPNIDNEKVRNGAQLIKQLYEDENQLVGGMLHVQLDDWNLGDERFDNPFEQWQIDLFQRQPLEVEKEIAKLFSTMTEDEQYSSLALYKRYWK